MSDEWDTDHASDDHTVDGTGDAAPVVTPTPPPPPPARPVNTDDDGDDGTPQQQRAATSLAKRTARVALGYNNAPADVAAVVAAAFDLRGPVDPVTLTAATVCGDVRGARAVITQMLESDVSDLPSAIQLAGKLTEDRKKAVRWWAVTAAIEVVVGDMPRQTSSAATTIVSGMSTLDGEQRALLEAALELLSVKR